TGRESPRLTLRAKGRRLRAEDFATLLPWIGVARPAGLQVSGSVDLDGAAELPIEHPEALRFKGSLGLEGLSYRDAGMALPLKDLSGHLTVDGDRAEWKDFKVRAGASSLEGSLQVEDFIHPRVGFKLTSPRIDLNEIIATLVPTTPTGTVPASAEAGAGSAGILEEISGAGRLDVKQVRFQTFDLSNVGASMTLAKSVFSLKDLRASLYGGTLNGSASVDLSRAVPRYALAARLKGVDVDPLLTDYDKELSGLLRGRLAGTLDLGASGAGMDTILKTAGGSGAVELTDGSLTSFSVLKQLAALLELAGGKGIGRESTPFESLTSELRIADGRARTDDLALRSTDLDLDAKGWVGLDSRLDLNVTALFSEESTRGMVAKNARLGGLTADDRLVIHFGLGGDLASPTFRLDSRAQVQTAKEKAKEKLRERVTDRFLKKLAPAEPEGTPEAPSGDQPPH
ncbi:MAG TPA: AsmA-like C-terminal region-containing protein, partial [Candidatus Polarisedimenticolia bacterium]|nr:AsmA-like C-terminal region-containing protein [Candidatus Polarisedimenticolia bacterium]